MQIISLSGWVLVLEKGGENDGGWLGGFNVIYNLSEKRYATSRVPNIHPLEK